MKHGRPLAATTVLPLLPLLHAAGHPLLQPLLLCGTCFVKGAVWHSGRAAFTVAAGAGGLVNQLLRHLLLLLFPEGGSMSPLVLLPSPCSG
jgi:hypothetical protein